MVGAFVYEETKKMSSETYLEVKASVTEKLEEIFNKVSVPIEFPGQEDHDSVEFLVADPYDTTSDITSLDERWDDLLDAIKSKLHAKSVRQAQDWGYKKNPDAVGPRSQRRRERKEKKRAGMTDASKTNTSTDSSSPKIDNRGEETMKLNVNCMHFAAPSSGSGSEELVQIDVKVCMRPDLFDWQLFCLGYGNISKILGSMVKPLELTIDGEGLHIRKREGDVKDARLHKIRITRSPVEALKVLGLDDSLSKRSLQTEDQLYEHIETSEMFDARHFLFQVRKKNYKNRLEKHYKSLLPFYEKWLPERHPGDQGKITHSMSDPVAAKDKVRQEVFRMMPDVRARYNFRVHLLHEKMIEELNEVVLRKMMMAAIPIDNESSLTTTKPNLQINIKGKNAIQIRQNNDEESELNTVLHLDGYAHKLDLPNDLQTVYPPPEDMRPEDKLVILSKWTHFEFAKGAFSISRNKRPSEMKWGYTRSAGMDESELQKWAKGAGSHAWVRETYTRHVGRSKHEEQKAQKTANNLA